MSAAFPGAWLALREPADAAARAPELLAALSHWARRSKGLRIVDLGCGSGSNLRALQRCLGARQSWRLLDRDPRLLALASAAAPLGGEAMEVSCERVDLRDTDAAFHPRPDVVTASALLDLASAPWIDAVCAGILATGAAAYFALNYDGRGSWSPPHALDGAVLAAVNRHQQRDKGLGGRALGPVAATHAAARLAAHGLAVTTAPSDWRLDAGQADLQRALLTYWQQAAAEDAEIAAPELRQWRETRRRWIETGRSRLTVGHLDVLALPPTASAHNR